MTEEKSKSVDEQAKVNEIVANRNLTEKKTLSINERLDILADEYYEKYF